MATAKEKTPPEYRALVDIDYINDETGEENHANAGDKITGLSENAVASELAAGNIEEWVDRQTENVRDLSANSGHVTFGVIVEEEGNQIVMKDVNE